MSKKQKAAPAAAAKFSLDVGFTLRLAATLFGICAVTALLLGVVNQITKPRIDAIQKAKREAAMSQVLPCADSFSLVEGVELPAGVTAIYEGICGGEAYWVVQTSTSGSQGAIEMMVGVDPSVAVTGVSVLRHSETPNIGTKVVADPSVLDRFTGMSHADGAITVNTGSNRFDGISGATYTSRGVAAGVNAALDAVQTLFFQ